MFCPHCGNKVNDDAYACTKCGRALVKSKSTEGGKDWLTTLLLVIFLGCLGIHRFYTGHTGIGIIQLLTFGGFGLWTLIDLIMIVTDDYTDAEGNSLVKN